MSSNPNGTVQWTNSPDWKVYTSQPVSCGPGWYEYGSSCYIVETTVTSTWQTARDDCAALGAHLAVITDAAENTFIVNLLTSLNIGFPVFWLGGNDMDVEGTYVWETAELFVFSAYSPTSIHGIDRNCINIIPSQGWYDDDCTLFLYHVCERNSG
ncbi:perlucin-like [Mya arenaria]|uniref:perlucin-like n=1 Tax=Mya arenaria TaxID=6604 RepID=UPI0022E5C497|nr:perlucin-like [Mya arenaria]